MAKTLTLEGEGGDLLVEVSINEAGWSLCYLLSDGRIYLGAESAAFLLSRLLDAVSDGVSPWPMDGELCGHQVRYALSLSEAHHVLYVADDGPDRLLFWQNSHPEPMTLAGTIRLVPELRRQWHDQLTAAFYDYSLHRARQAAITKEITEIVGGAEALK